MADDNTIDTASIDDEKQYDVRLKKTVVVDGHIVNPGSQLTLMKGRYVKENADRVLFAREHTDNISR